MSIKPVYVRTSHELSEAADHYPIHHANCLYFSLSLSLVLCADIMDELPGLSPIYTEHSHHQHHEHKSNQRLMHPVHSLGFNRHRNSLTFLSSIDLICCHRYRHHPLLHRRLHLHGDLRISYCCFRGYNIDETRKEKNTLKWRATDSSEKWVRARTHTPRPNTFSLFIFFLHSFDSISSCGRCRRRRRQIFRLLFFPAHLANNVSTTPLTSTDVKPSLYYSSIISSIGEREKKTTR